MISRSSFVSLTSLALANLVLLSPLEAAAQTQAPGDDAASLRQQGNDAMTALHPADALGYYNKAYELSKDPALLYNMGHAFEMMGDYPRALAKYESFRAGAPPELKARVPGLDALISDLRGRVTHVSIHCDIPGAHVLIRDPVRGAVFADLKLEGALLEQMFPAGSATVEVSAEGYAPYRVSTTFDPGGERTLEVRLVPVATAGILRITTAPVSATVLVDGEIVGQAPVEDTVPAGMHRIVVRHAGYPDVKTQAVAEAGKTKALAIHLEKSPPIFAEWWFWTSVGAAVVVGGVVLGLELNREKSPGMGSIPPGVASAPLTRF
jgi:hypothetical protein